jgi:ammonia channel protein AmtB
VAAAFAAIGLAVYDLRLLRERSTKRLWIGCVAATVVLTPVAGLLLYFAVDMLAAILAIPYALATVCTLARVLRRWQAGPNLRTSGFGL